MGVNFFPPETLSDFVLIGAVVTTISASGALFMGLLRLLWLHLRAFFGDAEQWVSFVVAAYITGIIVGVVAFMLKGVGL